MHCKSPFILFHPKFKFFLILKLRSLIILQYLICVHEHLKVSVLILKFILLLHFAKNSSHFLNGKALR